MLPFNQIAVINHGRRTARTAGRRQEIARAIRAIRNRARAAGIPRRAVWLVFATQAPIARIPSPVDTWTVTR